MLNGRRFGIFL